MGDVTALLCSSTHRKNDGGPKDSADHREGEACGESENTPNTGKEANDELWFFLGIIPLFLGIIPLLLGIFQG
jgi:hypothetical protein